MGLQSASPCAAFALPPRQRQAAARDPTHHISMALQFLARLFLALATLACGHTAQSPAPPPSPSSTSGDPAQEASGGARKAPPISVGPDLAFGALQPGATSAAAVVTIQ